MTFKVTKDLAQGVLCVVDAGLVNGVGKPIPGKMCVEAAVCYALGETHGDEPSCVERTLRDLKVELNDQSWSSDKARAKGLRRIAIAQLGSAGKFRSDKFWLTVNQLMADLFRTELVRRLQKLKAGKFDLDCLAQIAGFDDGSGQMDFCRVMDLDDVMNVLEEFDYPIKGVGKDKKLCFTAELFVQALIKMKIPGTRYLHLTKGKMNKKAVMAKVHRLRKAKGRE